MQPCATQKVSSELFESLKLYLNNKNRLQPIIGLRSITECVKVGSPSREVLYLCEVCECRLSKGDMRNHIMGSLHRYNYTKAWYPDLLSGVKEDSDMSLLARPLMEIARTLEDKDGPGDIKLLEVEDAAFQRIKGYSNSEAINLIRLLAHGPAQTNTRSNSAWTEQDDDRSQRVVFLAHSEVLVPAAEQDTSSEGVVHQAPLVRVQGSGRNFLNGYKGGKPLIGLHRVSECISDNGYTSCFLCHCCCTRVNKRGLIDHVSSSGHVFNYLMETRHEQVEVMGPDVHNKCQLLQSLAEQVEREEGRGDIEVINAPQFLTGLLPTKSYNWCIKRLWKRSHPNARRWNKAVQGSRVTRPPKKGEVHRKKRGTEVKNTVFKVSLPLTEGPLLLERTCFSQDSPPGSPVSWPEPQEEEPNLEVEEEPDLEWQEPNLNVDSEPFTENQSFDTDRYTPADLTVTHFEHQSDIGGDVNPDRLQHFQESTGRNSNSWQSPAPVAEWSTYSHAYSRQEGYALQWHNSSLPHTAHPSCNAHVERQDLPTITSQFGYQPHPTAQPASHGISGVAGHHMSAQKLPPPFAYPPAVHGNGTMPGHGLHFHGIKQEQYQTYTQFQSGPVPAAQTYWTQPVAYQAVQGQVYQGYHASPWSQPTPYCPHPPSHWRAHPDAFVPPGPAF
ncbi:uncharacterized protein si:ch211-199g17.2 isoform X2 [Dunckerocampus dactyliophorus]|uniref:uncharacterized protein si:ch211-199g17.2 isoform X2 n=1 Tax=Dunckerocampus dactyliophorus TaxID=161453 RepID=UPI002406C753|nr:uncharacterized protein si:ch211-199g17.2 isoform X2 [Dunckerocampus dactyliophorus]